MSEPGEVSGVHVSIHLKETTKITVDSQSTCEVLHFGTGITRVTVFVNTLAEARAFEKAAGQLVASMVKRKETADTIAEQAARIAELEQKLGERGPDE